MSLRATTGSVDDFGRVHEFEIHQQGYDGPVSALKNTGPGYASFDHEVIDPRRFLDSPIQKGALEVSVWLTDDSILDDLKSSDEREFWIVYKIDDVQEWAGYVYMDLSSYEENVTPYRLTLLAKDFTDLKGKNFALSDVRETIIETIQGILDQIGFDIPVITSTAWIEEHINSSQDFLRQIYHETRGLREFGRTGSEDPEPITLFEALEKICVNYGLILKQSGGAYRFDQLPAYDDPAQVFQTTYDGGVSETTVDTTTTGKVVISQNNRDNSGLPGLKKARVKFDHRNTISGILFPDEIEFTDSDSEQFEMPFISDGTQTLHLTGLVRALMREGATQASAVISIAIIRQGEDDYFWNGSSWASGGSVSLDLTNLGGDVFQGDIDIPTSPTPADADGVLRITIHSATGNTMPAVAHTTFYRGLNLDIENINSSVSDDFQLTQSGGYTASLELPPTWYGDGPNAFSVSALRYGEGDLDITSNSWQFRGSTAWRNFHENLLKTALDPQRGWRRLLSALIKSPYYAHQVLSYDGGYLFYLGGRLDVFTGNWTAEMFELNIRAGSDTFEEIPKFTADGSTGSAPPGGGGSGGGLTQPVADARYLKQSSNLGDLTNVVAARSNLGLGALAVLDKVDTGQIVDAAVTNAKLANSTISGVALGGNLAAHTAGNGLTGPTYNGAASRTWSVDPSAPVGIIEGKVGLNYSDPLTVAGGNLAVKLRAPVALSDGQIGLNRNDPLYLNGSNLDIRNHGDGQRGVLSPESQVIYGEKLFDADIGSPEWISQLLGWMMTEDGHLDTRSGRFGEIITQSFISDTTISRAGSDFLSESNAQLSEDFQVGTQENLQWQWEISWDSLLEKYEGWADSEGATDYDEIKTRLLFQSLYSEGLDRQWESGDDFMSESYERSVMVVDEHPGQDGFAVFENGHWIRLRAQQRDGGLRFQDFWCRVWWPDAYLEYEEYADWADSEGANSVDEEKTRELFSALYGTPQLFNGDGTQSYQVEFVYPKPIDPIVFRAGSVILSYGLPGQGIIERSAMGAPFDRSFAWHDRPWKEQLYDILWNLGDGSASGGTPGEIEVFIRDVFRTEFEDGGLRFGANADGQGNPGLYIDENNYFLLNRGFKATLEGNFVQTDNIIASINASPEGVAIDGVRLHVTADTVFDADVVIKGTLDGVDGTFSGTVSGATITGGTISGTTLSGVTGSFGNVTASGNITLTGADAGSSGILLLPGGGGLHGSGLSLTVDQQMTIGLASAGTLGGLRYSGGNHELFAANDLNLIPGFSGGVNITRMGGLNGRLSSTVSGSGTDQIITQANVSTIVVNPTASGWTIPTLSYPGVANGDIRYVMNISTASDVNGVFQLSGSSATNGFVRNYNVAPGEIVTLIRRNGRWYGPST